MAIREATTRVEEPAEAKPRPDRRRRRPDLRPGRFPTAGLEQWQDTETALTQLYRYAEGRAIEAIDWYLVDKRGKTTGRPSAPAAPPAPSTPSRSRTAWPCCGSSPTTWRALLQQETASWVLEFQSSLLRLERSNTPRFGSVPLHGAVEP